MSDGTSPVPDTAGVNPGRRYSKCPRLFYRAFAYWRVRCSIQNSYRTPGPFV
jgi:hypothetical protein